jgi:UrcA family protein
MRPSASLLIVPLIVALSPVCEAAIVHGADYEPVTRVVSYADLDLTDNEAVAVLYERIKTAAGAVCGPEDSRVLETFTRVRRCEHHAIVQAVKDVNAPKLTTFHLAATNQVDIAALR